MESSRSRDLVYALLEILSGRRSRRFGLGMTMEAGPLAYTSGKPGVPLSEEEEALLAFAACGITGYALADLAFERGQGGTMMASFLGRTIPSGDALHTVALIVMNAHATYYMKRPQDFATEEYDALVRLVEQEAYVDLYRCSRVRIRDGSTKPPAAPPFNLNVNQWSLYDAAATYFLPVNELTFMYINGLLECFNETTNYFVLDERAGYRPAGIARFGRSKGGHLMDDPRENRVVTVQQLESLVDEFVTIEQGMMIQNLALMSHALGLGGFPHWAAHPYAWFQTLGFRMSELNATQLLGMNRFQRIMGKLLGRDHPVPYVIGLEHDGATLLKPFCPPYYPSMEAAVRTVVELKFGPQGVFREGATRGAWLQPASIAKASPKLSECAIEATIAYCEYIYHRYGRFPAYHSPLKTSLGFQVNHLDMEFYDRHYRPEALTRTQRDHFKNWHER